MSLRRRIERDITRVRTSARSRTEPGTKIEGADRPRTGSADGTAAGQAPLRALGRRTQTLLGLLVCLLAIAVLVLVSTIREGVSPQGLSSRTYPYFLAVVLLALGIAQTALGLARKAPEAAPEGFPSRAGIVRVLVVLGVVALFPLAKYIGFLITSMAALAILFPTFGERRPRAIIVGVVGVPFTMYLLLTALGIPLP